MNIFSGDYPYRNDENNDYLSEYQNSYDNKHSYNLDGNKHSYDNDYIRNNIYMISVSHYDKHSKFEIDSKYNIKNINDDTIVNEVIRDFYDISEFKKIFEEFIQTVLNYNDVNRRVLIFTHGCCLGFNYNFCDITKLKNNCILTYLVEKVYQYKNKLLDIYIDLDIKISGIISKTINNPFVFVNKTTELEKFCYTLQGAYELSKKPTIDDLKEMGNLDYLFDLYENNDIMDKKLHKLKYNNVYCNDDDFCDIEIINGIVTINFDMSVYKNTKHIKQIIPISKYKYVNNTSLIFTNNDYNNNDYNNNDNDNNINNNNINNDFYLYEPILKFKKGDKNVPKLSLHLFIDLDFAYGTTLDFNISDNNINISDNHIKLAISNKLLKNTSLKNIIISRVNSKHINIFMNKYLHKFMITDLKKVLTPLQYRNNISVINSEYVQIKFIKFDLFKYIYLNKIVLINILRLKGYKYDCNYNYHHTCKYVYLMCIIKLIYYAFINNIPIELVYIILNHMFTKIM